MLDPLDMTYLYYVFNFNPDERLRVLLENFDLMPRPSGVGVKYRIVTKKPLVMVKTGKLPEQ